MLFGPRAPHQNGHDSHETPNEVLLLHRRCAQTSNMSATTMLLLFIILCLFSCSSATEKRYRKGEKVELTLDSIKSYHTQLAYSSEPFRHDGESDWAFTSKRRNDTTPYKIQNPHVERSVL